MDAVFTPRIGSVIDDDDVDDAAKRRSTTATVSTTSNLEIIIGMGWHTRRTDIHVERAQIDPTYP